MKHHTPNLTIPQMPTRDLRTPLWLSATEVSLLGYCLTKTMQLVRGKADIQGRHAPRDLDRIERIRNLARALEAFRNGRVDLEAEHVEMASFCLARAKAFLEYIARGKKGADLDGTLKKAEAVGALHTKLIDAEASADRAYLMGTVL